MVKGNEFLFIVMVLMELSPPFLPPPLAAVMTSFLSFSLILLILLAFLFLLLNQDLDTDHLDLEGLVDQEGREAVLKTPGLHQNPSPLSPSGLSPSGGGLSDSSSVSPLDCCSSTLSGASTSLGGGPGS